MIHIISDLLALTFSGEVWESVVDEQWFVVKRDNPVFVSLNNGNRGSFGTPRYQQSR